MKGITCFGKKTIKGFKLPIKITLIKVNFTQLVESTTGRKVTAEELSHFYRDYLQSHYNLHATYNRSLWVEQFTSLIPGIQYESHLFSKWLKTWAKKVFGTKTKGYYAHGVTVR